MVDSGSPAADYTVKQAAALLGLTEDAIRKRVFTGRLDGHSGGGVFLVSAQAVEAERQRLLTRLNAVDARPGIAAHDMRDEELGRLREELVRTQAALQSLVQAQASLNDTLRAQLDALQQLALPGSPRLLLENRGV
jgi:excisionase family DNA binding protein